MTPARTIVGIATALAGLCSLAAPQPASAQLVARFEIQGSVISPNGDGRQDSTRVVYALSDDAASLSVVVFEADSITPVDTLRVPGPDSPGGNRTLVWKGRRWDGALAAEGPYVVTLSATGLDQPDYLRSLPVFIDLTPPSIQIISVVPDPYAPGVPSGPSAVSISYVVSDASPIFVGRPPDEVKSSFVNPTNATIVPSSLTTTPPFAGADGAYVLAWNASSELATLADGAYRVTLTMTDAAGYSSVSSHVFEIDAKSPEVKVTSLAENSSVRVPPDSLRGFAYDVRGIDSLTVRYATTRPYLPVPSFSFHGDSLRFAVPLADSVSGEGPHSVYFRAVDNAGRALPYEYSVTIDLSAPPAPSLEPFDGKWHGSTYLLRGEFDDRNETGAYLRILRNGVPIDSLSTVPLGSTFSRNVPLISGVNLFTAVLRDGAFNTSPPSNTVIVRFDEGAGLYTPSPFVPGASFHVNAPRGANSAALRVFDLTGDLVALFEDDRALQQYSFVWNGLNGTGAAVKKGPLVAVAAIEYEDGSRDVYRRVILFDPDAQ